jgi:hypothetical protein
MDLSRGLVQSKVKNNIIFQTTKSNQRFTRDTARGTRHAEHGKHGRDVKRKA